METNMYDVGKIVNTHGVQGEVRVIRITDFEERFNPGSIVYVVKENDKPLPLTIISHRTHKDFDLLKFEDLDDINQVIHFKEALLKIKEEQLTELPEGEYYHHEIVDCEMYTVEGQKLGTITEVLVPGANDVFVVKQSTGKELLIPFIKDVVKKISIEEKKVIIKVMEGLLD